MRTIFLLLLLSLFLSSCSYMMYLYQPLEVEEQIITDISPILNESQQREIRKLQSSPAIVAYINQFWDDLDPIPETKVNEARIEYENRLEYVHTHFPYKRGWTHSDMARVYLIYGPPDDIYSMPWQLVFNLRGMDFKAIEIWTYAIGIGEIHKTTIFDEYDPGLVKFCFADILGSGRFTQIFSNIPGELIDPRVYLN